MAKISLAPQCDPLLEASESEALELLLDVNPVTITDGSGRIIFVNEVFLKLTGYTREELLGQDQQLLKADEQPLALHEKILRTIVSGQTWEGDVCNRHKSGNTFWTHTTVVPKLGSDGRPNRFISVYRDITERKRLEQEMKRANQWLSDFIENMPSGAVSILGDALSFNRKVEELTGYTRDEIRDLDSWYALVLGRERKADERSVGPGFNEGDIIQVFRKDGSLRRVQFNGMRNGANEIWLLHDLTERMEAEERFRVLFEHSAHALVLSRKRRLVDCNSAAVAMLGFSTKQELLARNPAEFSPLYQPDGRSSAETYLENERMVRECRTHRFEWIHRKKDGTEIPTEVTLNLIELAGEPAVIGAWRDLTEEKRAREQAMQTSKMVSLGEMAGGLAHEINNPLAIIKSRSQQIIDIADEPELDSRRLGRYAEQIDQTVDRIAKIITGLRNFAREAAADPFMPTCLNRVIDETLAFCRMRFKNQGIDLKVDTDRATDTTIDCRSVQISQVLLNLLNNAFDAVAGTAAAARGEGWVKISAISTDDGIEVSVSDNGHGVPKELRAKIMQPFFTTKEVGKGTGLGLSISRGLIEAHGGRFYLDDSSNTTRFVIWLPRKRPHDSEPDSPSGTQAA